VKQLPDLLEPHPRRRSTWSRALRLAGAVVFFLLGVVGWLLPVVTGIPFYVIALLLLASASDRARQWVNDAERRLPDRWRLVIRQALVKKRRDRRPDAS